MSYEKGWMLFAVGIIIFVGSIVYLIWAGENNTSNYYPHAHKVCYEHKPAQSWITTQAECMEVK